MLGMVTDHPSEYLMEYVLEVLDPATYDMVRTHVSECDICRMEVEQTQAELFAPRGDGPRVLVKHHLMNHVRFDQDLRAALREGARRSSVRWMTGAFFLVMGSIVASLLLWSGMEQRSMLAQDSTERREVAYTQSAEIVALLADESVERVVLAGVSNRATRAVMYRGSQPGVLVVVADLSALSDAESAMVWQVEADEARWLGQLNRSADGVAWLYNQQVPLCQSCDYLVTIETDPTTLVPSQRIIYQLMSP
jgi:hypothetical protein